MVRHLFFFSYLLYNKHMDRNGKKTIALGLTISILVLFVFVFFGHRFSNFERTRSNSFSITTDVINEHSEIEVDKSFEVLKLNKQVSYSVKFTTNSATAEIGHYPDPNFIYGVKGSTQNDLKITIKNNTNVYKNFNLKIYVLKNEEINELNSSKYTVSYSNLTSFCEIKDSNEIYIYSVIVMYTY